VRATRGGLFLYSGGKLEALDIPKSTPRVLNKNGIVVGSFGPGPEAQRRFCRAQRSRHAEPKPIDPNEFRLDTEVASNINDRGEIVGRGDHGGMENAVFLRRVSGGTNPSRQRRVRAGPPISLLRTFFAAL
jgi:hypothetical protein